MRRPARESRPAASTRSVNTVAVNSAPWPVLKISDVHWRRAVRGRTVARRRGAEAGQRGRRNSALTAGPPRWPAYDERDAVRKRVGPSARPTLSSLAAFPLIAPNCHGDAETRSYSAR